MLMTEYMRREFVVLRIYVDLCGFWGCITEFIVGSSSRVVHGFVHGCGWWQLLIRSSRPV